MNFSMKKNERIKQKKKEHELFLKKMGVHPTQLEKSLPKNTKGKRIGIYSIPDYKKDVDNSKLSNIIDGVGYKQKDKKYTGTLIKGIAVMHKSNSVPVLNDKEATDIARMRRG